MKQRIYPLSARRLRPLRDATEKVLFVYKSTQNKVHQSTLRHYLEYAKTVFQWRPKVGDELLPSSS